MKAKLTPLTVKSLAPPAQGQVDVYDAGVRGLLLRIAASGRKSWCAFYRHSGRNKRLTLGVYPDLSLADARNLAHKALRAVALGEDPAANKRATAVAADTFAQLCERFLIEYARPNLRPRTAYEYERQIRRTLLPAWGPRPAASISRKDVIEVASRIRAAGHAIMANRVLATIGVVFSWGLDHEIVPVNPATRMKKVRTVERPRKRDLSDAELRAVWEVGSEAIRLILLTAARRNEVGKMVWSEIDIDARTWALPESRTKAKRGHIIPLSPQAMAIIRGLDHRGERVLPGGVIRAYARARATTPFNWTLHDLRRGVRTGMGKLGVPPHIAERVLNHSPGRLIETYDKYTYLPEMRDALERWAVRLEQITGENVVPLTPAKMVSLSGAPIA